MYLKRFLEKINLWHDSVKSSTEPLTNKNGEKLYVYTHTHTYTYLHLMPLEIIIRAKNKEIYIQENLWKCIKEGWYLSQEYSLPLPSQFSVVRLYSRLLQPRMQGSLSPQFPAGELSSQEEQDVSVSHLVSSCLLLRLSPGQCSQEVVTPFFCLTSTYITVALP